MTEPTSSEHRDALLSGARSLAVWGVGIIGGSTAEAFHAAGVRVVGHDPDPRRSLDVAPRAGRPGVRVTTTLDDVLAPDVLVHLVAVPTERDGRPWTAVLEQVVGTIAAGVAEHRAQAAGGPPPLLVVESTVTPGTTERVLLPVLERHGLEVDRDVLLALAPRRDWFTAEQGSLRTLDRIYAGTGPAAADAAGGVLSLVNDVLHRAGSHLEGELVKCVENAFRHLDIALANQLTLAYPDVDMVDVLRLAGTKWNIATYHPSFGTGGYCIPLASRYLLDGSARPEELSLLSTAIGTDDGMRSRVADAFAGQGPVLLLGVAYKGDIKVDILSPARGIAARLRELGVPFRAHDPLYTAREIEDVVGPGAAVTDLAEAVAWASTVLVVADHSAFRGAPYVDLLGAEREQPLTVVDNQGVFADVVWGPHVRYARAGGAGWLSAEAVPV